MSEYSEFNKQLKAQGITGAAAQEARNAWFDNGGQLNTGSKSTTQGAQTTTSPTTTTPARSSTSTASAPTTTTQGSQNNNQSAGVASNGANIYRVEQGATAPQGAKVGDYVVTGGGTYKVTGVNSDGTYQSTLTNKDLTTYNYSGQYATAPVVAQNNYTINSPDGDSAYRSVLATGQSQKLSDGSILSLGPDGKVYSFVKGDPNQKVLAQNNYAPAPTPTPGSPNYVANIDPNANKYIIGTKDGHDALESVLKGGEANIRLTDGSYIRRDANGQVYIHDKNGNILGFNDTYQPPVTDGLQINAGDPTAKMRAWLEQNLGAAKQQVINQIDYATNKGINDLTRAEQDAQAQFQTQRNQVDRDEALSKDNQALYAEARGDRGGIGAAQYDSIQNAAAQNRLSVNQAQTKLSTDTARQIADLRAQGEFEKADKLLSLTQNYLAQLISLEQWGAEYGLNVAQFNANLAEWEAEFETKVANITGYYKGNKTMQVQQYEDNKRGQTALTLMQNGIMSEDWRAAGFSSRPEAEQYVSVVQQQQNAEKALNLFNTALKYNASVSDDVLAATGYDVATLKGILSTNKENVAADNNRSLVNAAIQAGINLDESLIRSVGYDVTTVNKLIENTAQNAVESKARDTVNALINAGQVGVLKSNPQLVKDAGLQMEIATALATAAAASSGSRSGGGGSGGSGGGGGGGTPNNSDMSSIDAWAKQAGTDGLTYMIANYDALGYKTPEAAEKAWDNYETQQSAKKDLYGTQYDQILKVAKQNKADGYSPERIMASINAHTKTQITDAGVEAVMRAIGII